jgi:hypothetical protein
MIRLIRDLQFICLEIPRERQRENTSEMPTRFANNGLGDSIQYTATRPGVLQAVRTKPLGGGRRAGVILLNTGWAFTRGQATFKSSSTGRHP